MWFELRGHKKGAGSACGGMKRLAAAMAAVLCLLPGCGRREKNLSIRMDLSSAVTSVDPQFATSAENQLIMNNIFEGLLIRGEKGYTVSSNISTAEIPIEIIFRTLFLLLIVFLT